MTPFLRLLIAFSIFSAIPAFGQSAPESNGTQLDRGTLIIKNLFNGKTAPTEGIEMKCRPDGYFCKSSAECCGMCHNGACDNGGGGGGCHPDGSACKSSSTCCGMCHNGMCDNGGGGSTCRPAGLGCKSSAQCCGMCHDGVCS